MNIAPSESEIQKAILSYLKMRGHLVKRNQSGVSSQTYNGKKRFIHMGEKGWPDIIGITGNNTPSWAPGTFMGIEVKSRKGKTTLEQDKILEEIRSRNGIGIVARDVEDLIEMGL